MTVFHILTLFPDSFRGLTQFSLLRRAQERGFLRCEWHALRDYAIDSHRTVDGAPYGGGEGMVLRADVLARACQAIQGGQPAGRSLKRVLLSPQGQLWTQERVEAWAAWEVDFLLICGHYEGVDERFIQRYVDVEVSIGDYILTGGELPALVLLDSLARLIPGVVGNPRSVGEDSFSTAQGGGLKHPQYTRPVDFEGLEVPSVLRSGDHGRIAEWRREQSQLRTVERRPYSNPKRS